MGSEENFKVNDVSARLRKMKKPRDDFKISKEQEEKLLELFRTFEKDLEPNLGEGKIPSKYVKLILRAMHMEPSPEELKELIHQLSPEDPSCISLSSLVELVKIKMRDKNSNIDLERSFDRMDVDQKGYLSIRDLRRMAKEIGENLSEEEMQEMIDEASSRNNGRVTKDDFVKFMNKCHENGV